jgi:hypothetical protein
MEWRWSEKLNRVVSKLNFSNLTCGWKMVAQVFSTELSGAIGMNSSSTRSCDSRQASHRLDAMSDADRSVLLGLVFVGIVLAFSVMALIWAASRPPLKVRDCSGRIANDEHASMVAFFQDPADQGELLQAIEDCAKRP